MTRVRARLGVGGTASVGAMAGSRWAQLGLGSGRVRIGLGVGGTASVGAMAGSRWA